MKLTEIISQHVLEAFEGINWTEVDLKDILENVSFEEAITITDASPNTIASIVYHLNFYNEEMTFRAKGIRREINGANGFDMPELKNKEDWRALKKAMFSSVKELSETIKKIPEEKIFEPILKDSSTAYKSFHGIAEHAHYHSGQILLLKNLVHKNED